MKYIQEIELIEKQKMKIKLGGFEFDTLEYVKVLSDYLDKKMSEHKIKMVFPELFNEMYKEIEEMDKRGHFFEEYNDFGININWNAIEKMVGVPRKSTIGNNILYCGSMKKEGRAAFLLAKSILLQKEIKSINLRSYEWQPDSSIDENSRSIVLVWENSLDMWCLIQSSAGEYFKVRLSGPNKLDLSTIEKMQVEFNTDAELVDLRYEVSNYFECKLCGIDYSYKRDGVTKIQVEIALETIKKIKETFDLEKIDKNIVRKIVTSVNRSLDNPIADYYCRSYLEDVSVGCFDEDNKSKIAISFEDVFSHHYEDTEEDINSLIAYNILETKDYYYFDDLSIFGYISKEPLSNVVIKLSDKKRMLIVRNQDKTFEYCYINNNNKIIT